MERAGVTRGWGAVCYCSWSLWCRGAGVHRADIGAACLVELHRRHLLADAIADRTDPQHLATVLGSLPIEQHADGVAVAIALYDDAKPAMTASAAMDERQKLATFTWTASTLKRHIVLLQTAFISFEAATATTLTQVPLASTRGWPWTVAALRLWPRPSQ